MKCLSELLQMLTLGIGIGVLLTSLLLTYVMSSKADILFSSGREPTTATYWSSIWRRRWPTHDHYHHYYYYHKDCNSNYPPPPNPKPHMDRLFFLETNKKKNTCRYMDRVDTASESGREGEREGEWGGLGCVGGITFWDKDCMFMDSLRWGETWWGLDRIRTSQGHQELVRHQQALPVANNVYNFFVLGIFFVCVSHFSFFKCTKKIWMFVYCHEIGT